MAALLLRALFSGGSPPGPQLLTSSALTLPPSPGWYGSGVPASPGVLVPWATSFTRLSLDNQPPPPAAAAAVAAAHHGKVVS
jgi:hypothetical protein